MRSELHPLLFGDDDEDSEDEHDDGQLGLEAKYHIALDEKKKVLLDELLRKSDPALKVCLAICQCYELSIMTCLHRRTFFHV